MKIENSKERKNKNKYEKRYGYKKEKPVHTWYIKKFVKAQKETDNKTKKERKTRDEK